MKVKILSGYIIVIIVIVVGCSRHSSHDPRLEKAYSLADSVPEESLGILDGIDTVRLPEPDKYYYMFVRLKSLDKKYVRHTSDSTILTKDNMKRRAIS